MALKLSLWTACLLAVGVAYLAVRASSNLVTLDVRNAELRKVVGKIKWQTWETIFVLPNVEGKVTLKVKKMPLESVLEIVAQQTSSRWTAVYPLYTTGKSLAQLQQVVLGEQSVEESRWKAWQTSALMPRFMFGDNARSENTRVTLKLEDKDVEFASFALARFARAQIVPEEGTDGRINLDLQQAPMREAVAQLSRQTGRKSTVFYVMQPGFRMSRSRTAPSEGERPQTSRLATEETSRLFKTNQVADLPAASTTSTIAVGESTNRPGETSLRGSQRPQRAPEEEAVRQKQFEAQLAAMPPEERARAEQMRQRMDQLRELPPEERRQQMGEFFNSPEMRQQMQERLVDRIISGIQNSTPEQRVERYQRMNEMRRRFEQREN